MSIADKYQEFIEKKPTKEEYLKMRKSLTALQTKQVELEKLNFKVVALINETRRMLEYYRFTV